MEKRFGDAIVEMAARLHDSSIDADKFGKGNETAGVRTRAMLMAVSNQCRRLRKEMLDVSADRRASK